MLVNPEWRPQHFGSNSYKIYRNIPDIIQNIPKKNIFKKRLKCYMINNDDLPVNRDPIPTL